MSRTLRRGCRWARISPLSSRQPPTCSVRCSSSRTPLRSSTSALRSCVTGSANGSWSLSQDLPAGSDGSGRSGTGRTGTTGTGFTTPDDLTTTDDLSRPDPATAAGPALPAVLERSDDLDVRGSDHY